jgi:23S rRNA (uracil1939-C5)-methyltransferase
MVPRFIGHLQAAILVPIDIPPVIQAIAQAGPSRVVYVSCNPASLARDLGILDGLGYRAVKVQPVDMFPNTSSIEAVALIVRKDA